MPLYKYRNIDDARLDLLKQAGTLAERIDSVWACSAAMVGIQRPRGLRKFRSIEEANAEDVAWKRDRARLLRRRVRSSTEVDRIVGLYNGTPEGSVTAHLLHNESVLPLLEKLSPVLRDAFPGCGVALVLEDDDSLTVRVAGDPEKNDAEAWRKFDLWWVENRAPAGCRVRVESSGPAP